MFSLQTLGKILPIEGYEVYMEGNPPVNYAISLTHLYQPLIGVNAVTLYQTLMHEAWIYEKSNFPQTHHTLMNYLNLSLNELYKARLKLEGIGLLETFQKEETEEKKGKHYTYLLKRPFSPQKFFKDPMLSELLCHHIGRNKVKDLQEHFLKEQQYIQSTPGKRVTASFRDVFQTFQPSFSDEMMTNDEHQQKEDKSVYHIDFTWIKKMLKRRMIPVKRILTNENKKLISDMKLLYQLTTYEVEKSLLWALTEDHTLDREEFKAACHDTFKAKNNEKPIQLTFNQQMFKEEKQKEPKTKEEKLIQRLETISPKQLLEDLSRGNRASAQDLKIIREVMTNQGLPSPVMNVLIHYVLLQSDMQLSKAYLETIASHWSRAGLETAEEAMNFARKQIQKFKHRKQNHRYKNQQRTREVIPDWFLNEDRRARPEKKAENVEHLKDQPDLETLIKEFAED